ncbi:LytTR family DNA-binding domain-containing protein [uncultured Tenacibaculum sp.]|uniref:LytR/AlgR family response regulator transcription factor n=1 Tax=uncultured Tenacibaculum sp. TaxID=174713 RepID=UPI00262992AC|nr:LytTR family DNA-binding domain-containing protein [uncultured Tenacibaculum sp.]
MLKTLIIEDERHVRENLKKRVFQDFQNELFIIDEAISVKEGIEKIKRYQPQLVFMDVDLGDGTSFDILSSLEEINFKIIFVTGFDSHAIKAIRLGALDYLLKPIDDDEFVEAVKKAVNTIQKENMLSNSITIANHYYREGEHHKIVLKTLDTQHLVSFDDILYCKSEGNYTTFYLFEESIVISKPMKKVEELLDKKRFIKCHQSFIVNKAYITKYTNEGFLVTKTGEQIPVATRRKDMVLKNLF